MIRNIFLSLCCVAAAYWVMYQNDFEVDAASVIKVGVLAFLAAIQVMPAKLITILHKLVSGELGISGLFSNTDNTASPTKPSTQEGDEFASFRATLNQLLEVAETQRTETQTLPSPEATKTLSSLSQSLILKIRMRYGQELNVSDK